MKEIRKVFFRKNGKINKNVRKNSNKLASGTENSGMRPCLHFNMQIQIQRFFSIDKFLDAIP
uniref:Uncharacterized protein n=1 Tax=Romanomermis culicivorax TaxID=13658 RepID=A0A915J4W6_ROMCU